MFDYLKIMFLSFCVLTISSTVSLFIVEKISIPFETLISANILLLIGLSIIAYLLKSYKVILSSFLCVIYAIIIMLFKEVLTSTYLCDGQIQFLDIQYQILYSILLLVILFASAWFNIKSLNTKLDKIFPVLIGIIYYIMFIHLAWLSPISGMIYLLLNQR